MVLLGQGQELADLIWLGLAPHRLEAELLGDLRMYVDVISALWRSIRRAASDHRLTDLTDSEDLRLLNEHRSILYPYFYETVRSREEWMSERP
jgi:hypothetical protein